MSEVARQGETLVSEGVYKAILRAAAIFGLFSSVVIVYRVCYSSSYFLYLAFNLLMLSKAKYSGSSTLCPMSMKKRFNRS